MKICIVGKGLTSLVLAKALVNKDIFVDVIYSQKPKKIYDNRTLGISKSNIEFFNKHITDINKIIWDIKNIEIYTENLKKEKIIQFNDSENKLFSIIKNQALLDQLNYELKKNKFFNLKKKNGYDDIIKTKYNLIINCDSCNKITKKLFSNKLEKNYNSVAFTTVLNHKKLSLNNTATQIFTNKGPLAFLPISKERTSVVYSFRYTDKLNERAIINLIKKFNPKYKIKKIDKITKFNLKSLNLRKYYKNNIMAFGDLLHKIHPLAGQGFNMSVRDIRNLTKIIQEKKELGLPMDSSICSEFENITKSKNYIFANGIDFIYEFFNFESKLQSSFLSSSIKFLGKNKSVKKYFKKFADIGLGV